MVQKITDVTGYNVHTERKKTISFNTDDIKQKVKQFYACDDISRQAPGKKDAVTVKEDGVKKTYQKRHLTMSVLEAYSLSGRAPRNKNRKI